MSFTALKQAVYDANVALVRSGLVILTWGNASGIDRAAADHGGRPVMAIKPSGIAYDKLAPEDIVVLDLASGQTIEGKARPSSDTPTHLHLYRCFANIGGIVHTHSLHATSFAQAQRPIDCLGTTHADTFYGTVPCTRPLTAAEIATDYELNTGKVIVETFTARHLDPAAIPAVLVASHAPFTWGKSPAQAAENALILESVAHMQIQTYALNAAIPPVPQALLDKHYLRKHGPGAYYGQKA
jgi:L-ribulose-5-phosphate 4-epimerase